ncbi:MAG: integration host factor subunit beta [Pseudomonadota bacterium]
MTRSELIEKLTQTQTNLMPEDVDLAVREILEHMSASLAEGSRVEIRGFGSFTLHHRPAREGRNPRTGEEVMVEERYTPRFRPGKLLRDRIMAAIQ